MIAAAITKASGKLRVEGQARMRGRKKKGEMPAGRAYEIAECQKLKRPINLTKSIVS